MTGHVPSRRSTQVPCREEGRLGKSAWSRPRCNSSKLHVAMSRSRAFDALFDALFDGNAEALVPPLRPLDAAFHRFLRAVRNSSMCCNSRRTGLAAVSWRVGLDVPEKLLAMPVVAVINRAVVARARWATHLAGYCANAGAAVILGDVDRQLSTQIWLRQRKTRQLGQAKEIRGWSIDPRSFVRPPAGIEHVIVDTPGGLRGFDLARSSCTRTRSDTGVQLYL